MSVAESIIAGTLGLAATLLGLIMSCLAIMGWAAQGVLGFRQQYMIATGFVLTLLGLFSCMRRRVATFLLAAVPFGLAAAHFRKLIHASMVSPAWETLSVTLAITPMVVLVMEHLRRRRMYPTQPDKAPKCR